ncbi:hypothetical protein OG995_30695 [Micromonospora zamorensis]
MRILWRRYGNKYVRSAEGSDYGDMPVDVQWMMQVIDVDLADVAEAYLDFGKSQE